MNRAIAISLGTILLAATAFAAEDSSKELDRVKAAGTVIREIEQTPDKGIPSEIMASADCVAVIPSMLNGGFVFGGRYGKGVATCRHGNAWSAPVPIRIEGGSWGLQIGGQAVDLVMVVMNRKGMDQLLTSKFKVGADVSAAAGPVGRHVEGTTDWKMRAQVLTYSRARGAFAGITLNGAVLKQDDDDTTALYGKTIPFAQILNGSVPPPAGTQTFIADVSTYFDQAKSGEVANASAPSSSSSAGTTGSATSAGGKTENPTAARTQAIGSQTSNSAGTSGTATETTPASDVKNNIEKALRGAPNTNTSNVTVNVTGNSIELTGSVPTEEDKQSVRNIAEQNANGRRVSDSGLTVKP